MILLCSHPEMQRFPYPWIIVVLRCAAQHHYLQRNQEGDPLDVVGADRKQFSSTRRLRRLGSYHQLGLVKRKHGAVRIVNK